MQKADKRQAQEVPAFLLSVPTDMYRFAETQDF